MWEKMLEAILTWVSSFIQLLPVFRYRHHQNQQPTPIFLHRYHHQNQKKKMNRKLSLERLQEAVFCRQFNIIFLYTGFLESVSVVVAVWLERLFFLFGFMVIYD